MNRPLKILHVFYDIVPLTGYQIRSKYVLANQKRLGLDLTAVFLPTQMKNCVWTLLGGVPVVPLEIPGILKGLIGLKPISIVGTMQRGLMRRLFRSYLFKIIGETKPSIVHAHSAWMSAAQAFAAARLAGIPFLYEIRGLWEETAISEGRASQLGPRYSYFRLHENHLIRNADAVITLSDGLRREMIFRGSNAERTSVVPNGVDTEEFVPMSCDSKLAESLGCGARTVVGYISSLRRMEGVKYLVEAIQKVDENAFAIVVGDGPERASLERLARDLHVQGRIKFVGAVPHAEIKKYYSIIDIFVVPRTKDKVCRVVTPLKPLEAMAMGKCLLMSDVEGLRELAKEGETAFFFEPEDSAALAARLNALIADEELRRKVGGNARRYVVRERDWRKLMEEYISIYEELLR